MSWDIYTSEDESAKVHINLTSGKVKIEDVDASEEWTTPLGSEEADALDLIITPGFKNGKIMMWIAKKIKEVLT